MNLLAIKPQDTNIYGLVFTGRFMSPGLDTFHKDSHQEKKKSFIIPKCFTNSLTPNYLKSVLLFYLTYQFLLLSPLVLLKASLQLQSPCLEVFTSVFTLATPLQPKLAAMSLWPPTLTSAPYLECALYLLCLLFNHHSFRPGF